MAIGRKGRTLAKKAVSAGKKRPKKQGAIKQLKSVFKARKAQKTAKKAGKRGASGVGRAQSPRARGRK